MTKDAALEIGRAGEGHQEGGDVRRYAVTNDGVRIAVTRGGHARGGRKRVLVFCPGLASTQAGLQEFVGLLRRDFEVVTFDLRGHGLSSVGERYLFVDFLGDVDAVMSHVGAEAPVLVGYSLGADLAVHYASEHPERVGELVLIDGANPVPEPFVTEEDLPMFRALWEAMAAEQEGLRGTPRQVLLDAQQILEVNVEIDTIRAAILDRYRMIDRPITMIMSTAMAGDSGEGRAAALNQNWQAGLERLMHEHPDINAHRLDADHSLVLTHTQEIAEIIRGT